jgi:phage major head subunit gpT-like protein
MGQVVSSDIPKQLLPGLKTIFQQGWTRANLTYKQIVTEVDSNAASEDYGWLGQVPAVREWKDERIPKGLSEFTYTIRNKKWEASIRVDRTVLEDEQYGQIRARVAQLPGAVERHQNKLVFDAFAAGFTALAYDGQYYFDTDHSEGNSGTQSNKFTTALSASSYATARAAGMGFKDDQGELLGFNHNLLIVPPALESTARTLLNAEFVSDGTTTVTNIWRNSADLLVVPFLSDATDWFLVDTNALTRPIIFQNRIPVSFNALDDADSSESAFMRDHYVYGVRARYNVGYGDWRSAIGSAVA